MSTKPSTTSLFDPIQLGDLLLPHRLAMAPLTRGRSGAGDVPTSMMAEYYAQRARAYRGVAGAAPIISEATQISVQGRGYPHSPGVFTPEQLAGWRLVTDAVHAEGGTIICQLWHVGRMSHPDFQNNGELPVAPSAIAPPGPKRVYNDVRKPHEIPRALEAREIPAVITDFVSAARNAISAGFDAVEIHGANGYLIDQFLRTGTNHRTDDWGGSLENRCRFALEVAAAVCNAVGPSRVGIRLSPTSGAGEAQGQGDLNPIETFTHLVARLAPLKMMYLHLLRAWEADAKDAVREVPLNLFRPIWKKSDGTPGVLMFNNRYDRASALAAVESGECDMIAMGRLFISNPDLPARFKHNQPITPADPATFYSKGAAGYTDYPPLNE